MKLLLLPFTLIASSLFLNAEASIWQPSQHDSWNIALGTKMDINKEKAKIVEIDYENKKELIKEYHKLGKKVICYFSGGTIEKWRGDISEFRKVDGLIRNKYTDWEGEWWLDYRVEGIKPLLKNRMKDAINEGCDAIDVDNIDGYQIKDVKDKWSNPLTRDDAIKFTTWLGQTAHSLGISIGLKNGLDIIDTVGKYYNFAINEGCIRRDECHWYKNFLATGKPVFGITYGGLTDSNRKGLCKNLENLPISMIIKEGKKLVQDYTVFDGKKHCGSSFKSGKVSQPSVDVKKTTTTLMSAAVKPIATSIPVNNKPVQVQKPVQIQKPDQMQIPDQMQKPVQNLNPNPSQQGIINNGPMIMGNVTVTRTPVLKGENDDTLVDAPVDTPVDSPFGTPSPNISSPSIEGDEINDQFNDKDKGNSKTIIGVAVTGSIIGAAALLIFIKKNPKHYENLKRSLSRRRTTRSTRSATSGNTQNEYGYGY